MEMYPTTTAAASSMAARQAARHARRRRELWRSIFEPSALSCFDIIQSKSPVERTDNETFALELYDLMQAYPECIDLGIHLMLVFHHARSDEQLACDRLALRQAEGRTA